jgi:hypothetical protein
MAAAIKCTSSREHQSAGEQNRNVHMGASHQACARLMVHGMVQACTGGGHTCRLPGSSPSRRAAPRAGCCPRCWRCHTPSPPAPFPPRVGHLVNCDRGQSQARTVVTVQMPCRHPRCTRAGLQRNHAGMAVAAELCCSGLPGRAALRCATRRQAIIEWASTMHAATTW